MENSENLYFDPATGQLSTSRPNNDKAIALDMNKQGPGGFFGLHVRGPTEHHNTEGTDKDVLNTERKLKLLK